MLGLHSTESTEPCKLLIGVNTGAKDHKLDDKIKLKVPVLNIFN